MQKKVIILTLPLENNYGGLLQAYALQNVVSRMGYDVDTDINACKNKTWKNHLLWIYLPIRNKLRELFGKKVVSTQIKKYRNQRLTKFILENIRTVDFFKGKDDPPRKNIDNYEIFIVGSDQVWRKKYVRVKSYFLDFLKERQDKLRIAYAASFGLSTIDEWTVDDKESCMRMAKQFDAISVREVDGLKLLKELKTEGTHVLDPTMLLNKEDYLKLDDIEQQPIREKLLFCYVIDMTDDKRTLIERIRKARGLNNIHFISPKMDGSSSGTPADFIYPSVGEWLSGFRDADFIFTDSFHGTVFSILFNKQFICYGNKDRGLSRFDSLLGSFGLKERMVFKPEDFTDIIHTNINYSVVNKKLETLRNDSHEFLRKSIGVQK